MFQRTTERGRHFRGQIEGRPEIMDETKGHKKYCNLVCITGVTYGQGCLLVMNCLNLIGYPTLFWGVVMFGGSYIDSYIALTSMVNQKQTCVMLLLNMSRRSLKITHQKLMTQAICTVDSITSAGILVSHFTVKAICTLLCVSIYYTKSVCSKFPSVGCKIQRLYFMTRFQVL